MATFPTRDFGAVIQALFDEDPDLRAEVESGVRRMKFAQRLYKLRQDWGVSQAEFAQRLGLSRSRVWRIEQNDIDALTLDVIEQIALKTGLEFHWEVRDPAAAIAEKTQEPKRTKKAA